MEETAAVVAGPEATALTTMQPRAKARAAHRDARVAGPAEHALARADMLLTTELLSQPPAESVRQLG